MSILWGKTCSQLGKFIQKNVPVISKCNLAFSTAPDVDTVVTSEKSPGKHTQKDLGLFYTLPNSLSLKTLYFELLHFEYVEECITFGETPFLIKKPALEIINYLKNTDFNAPVNKYVLYGKHGSGKTMTLYHLIHYAYDSKWLIVHCPTMLNWLYAKRAEKAESTTEKGLLDLPRVAAKWLAHFKNQNESLIKSLDLQLQNDYEWNVKEVNKRGENLINMINHGIGRTKYACDVIKALLSEIKLLSSSGKVKTLVCIDDYDYIFRDFTKVRGMNYEPILPEQISCVTALKNLAKSDWNNGAVVVTCSTTENSNDLDDHLPMNQLGTKGIDFLAPFIPVEVPRLTDKEIKSILTYYREKKWLRTSENDEEIKWLSCGNHLMIRRICESL